MTSLKKAKGKARRAAKAKAKEDEAVTNQPLGGQPSQRNDAPMSGGITTTARCNHGLVPSHYHPQSHIASNNLQTCKWFLQAFVNEFDGTAGDFLAAYHATKEKCAVVWNDPSMMEFVVSFLLACGTGKVMEGNNIKIASKYAALACYFEQYIQVELLNTRPFPNWPKIRELYAANSHTTVSFLKRRIPCSCLDEKYKEVKSIPKIGLCCSPECPLPCGKTELSATMCCSRCRAANYCSRECQVAAWQGHRGECGFYAELKAKFKENKENS
eukprot:scaffold20768_cov138-Skeletonema_dohrnii-CCMP3373.AAC.6